MRPYCLSDTKNPITNSLYKPDAWLARADQIRFLCFTFDAEVTVRLLLGRDANDRVESRLRLVISVEQKRSAVAAP